MSIKGVSCTLPSVKLINNLDIYHIIGPNVKELGGNYFPPPMTYSLRTNGATYDDYQGVMSNDFIFAVLILDDKCDGLHKFAKARYREKIIPVNDRTGVILPIWCFNTNDCNVSDLFPGKYERVNTKQGVVAKTKVWQPSYTCESKEFTLELLEQIRSANIMPIPGVIYPTDLYGSSEPEKQYRQKDNYYYEYNGEVYLVRQVRYGSNIPEKRKIPGYNDGDYIAYKIIEADMYFQQVEDCMYATSLDFVTGIRPLDTPIFFEVYVENFLNLQSKIREYKEKRNIETGNFPSEQGDPIVRNLVDYFIRLKLTNRQKEEFIKQILIKMKENGERSYE